MKKKPDPNPWLNLYYTPILCITTRASAASQAMPGLEKDYQKNIGQGISIWLSCRFQTVCISIHPSKKRVAPPTSPSPRSNIWICPCFDKINLHVVFMSSHAFQRLKTNSDCLYKRAGKPCSSFTLREKRSHRWAKTRYFLERSYSMNCLFVSLLKIMLSSFLLIIKCLGFLLTIKYLHIHFVIMSFQSFEGRICLFKAWFL